MLSTNLRKPHPFLRLNPYHTSIKPSQTSLILAFESFLCEQKTCTNITTACVWIFIMRASNLHKPPPLLRLNPYHACIRPSQTSPTPASESLSCVHQTCTNLAHTCVWILLIQASNLHKPQTLLCLNPYHLVIKPAQTSPTPAYESFSYKHQTCIKLIHTCVWILLIQAPNLHAHSSVWILLMRASNLNKPHPLLRLNHSHASI